MALLQDQMRALDERIGKMQAMFQQLTQQSTDNMTRSARADRVQAAMAQSIRSEADRLNGSITGVATKLDGAVNEITQLRDASTATSRQVTAMRSQMDDMNNVLKALQAPPAAPPAPDNQTVQASKLFTDATRDMSGKEDLALGEFADFLRLFPTDPQAPHALFNVGQIHYGQGQFEKAAKDFDAVAAQFPGSEYEQDAMYMKGRSLLKAGRRSAAVDVFKALIAKYPQSTQASQARDQLRSLPSPAPGKRR
jgi:TolA-binding protein